MRLMPCVCSYETNLKLFSFAFFLLCCIAVVFLIRWGNWGNDLLFDYTFPLLVRFVDCVGENGSEFSLTS